MATNNLEVDARSEAYTGVRETNDDGEANLYLSGLLFKQRELFNGRGQVALYDKKLA